MRRPRVHLTGALDGMVDLIFPKRCVVCRAAGSWLCAVCERDLRPLPDDRCRRCGAPLARAGRPARVARAAPSSTLAAGGVARHAAACRFAGLSRVRRPRPCLLGRVGRLLLRGAGAFPRHRVQVPRFALARRRSRRASGSGFLGSGRPRRWRRHRHVGAGPSRPPAGPRLRSRRVLRPAACTGRWSHLCSAAPSRASWGPPERIGQDLARGQRLPCIRVAR